jgi:hypothetical protein
MTLEEVTTDAQQPASSGLSIDCPKDNEGCGGEKENGCQVISARGFGLGLLPEVP